MVFWGRIGPARVEFLSHQCKRCCSQIYGVSLLMNDAAGVRRRFGILEKYLSARTFAAPVQAKTKVEAKNSQSPRLNQAIVAKFVRLVTEEGHSVVPRHEALDRAMKLKLDLVEVQRNANPPVCKIMDFHREKYEQQLKEKDRLKSKSEVTLRKGDPKEVRFTLKTELKDLKMKADSIKRLMDSGYRVKCMAIYPKKMKDKDKCTEEGDLEGLLSQLSTLIEDVAFVESGPRVEKRQAYIVVRHIKYGSTKKSPGKKASKVGEAIRSDIQKDATSSQKLASPTHSQVPLEIEEQTTTESDSENEDDDLSDEDVDRLNFSETPSTTRSEEPEGELNKEMEWSAFDANVDFEEVFTIDGNKDDTTSSFTENNTMGSVDVLSPLKGVAGLTEVLSNELPLSSVVKGPNLNQGQNLERHKTIDLSDAIQMLDTVKEEIGSWKEQKGREFTPGNIPTHSESSLASKNRYSRGNELNGRFQQMKQTDIRNRISKNVCFDASESSSVAQRGQVNNRGLTGNDFPGPKNQSPDPRWQPRPAVNADSRNLKPSQMDESQKQGQADVKQGPSLSSYGIFSTPKTAASSDQRTSAEVNRNEDRNATNPARSIRSNRISSNQEAPKPMKEGPSQDADKNRHGGWGIFSNDNSNPNQHKNSDNQMKVQR